MSFDCSQYFDVSQELAKQARNIADYDLNNPALNNLPFTTQAVLRWTKEALAKLQQLQSN